jgi:hypothetical protein
MPARFAASLFRQTKSCWPWDQKTKVLVIWDLATKKELARLHGHSYAVGPIRISA